MRYVTIGTARTLRPAHTSSHSPMSIVINLPSGAYECDPSNILDVCYSSPINNHQCFRHRIGGRLRGGTSQK
jgi:hypothetical protein